MDSICRFRSLLRTVTDCEAWRLLWSRLPVAVIRCHRLQVAATSDETLHCMHGWSFKAVQLSDRQHSDGRPVSHYSIPPEKSPPADNLPVKIRPGRDGFLPVNCRPDETFLRAILWWGYFLWGRRYFNRGGAYLIRDYLSPGGFSYGETF